MNKQLEQMYRLAVWDQQGRMYMPVYSKISGAIELYAPAQAALRKWTRDWKLD